METKYEVSLLLVLLALAFASGRYSVSNPEVDTKVIAKIDEQKQIDKDKHTRTVTVTTKTPDGTVNSTVTEESDVVTHLDTNKSTNIQQQQSVIPEKKGTLLVSALVGVDVFQPKLVYGASISKEILGPITLGAWGLNNGTAGLSVGITF